MAIDPATDISSFSFCRISSVLEPRCGECSPSVHDIRNLGEYEGDPNVDERIVADLTAACQVVSAKVDALKR